VSTDLFVYGMLLAPTFHRGETEVLGPATLPGWRLEFDYYAMVVEGGAEDECPGLVIRVDDQELRRMDSAEGVDQRNPHSRRNGFYRREHVTVVMGDGSERDAQVYACNHWKGFGELPNDGYLSMILGGYEDHGLPTARLYESLHRAKSQESRRYWSDGVQ
jgi:gamma-glutamylcyclotransferase (GGCT)/AIG2-like uncharacterized protein YtfP